MIHRGFDVAVYCDGQQLPEFQLRMRNDRKTIDCYIPSEEGKGFEIRWRDCEARTGWTSVRCYIDGRKPEGSPCPPGGNGSRWGVRTQADMRRPFTFARMITTDDEDQIIDGKALNRLGTIRVRVVRIAPVNKRAKTEFSPIRVINDATPVNEKQKKAGAHCVALGDARPCISKKLQAIARLPGEDFWVTFNFRYRPLARLQADGIVPQGFARGSSGSRPSQQRVKREDIASEKRVRANNLPRVKAEPRDSRRLRVPIVKEEDMIDLTNERPRSPIDAAFMHGQTIDLTLDD